MHKFIWEYDPWTSLLLLVMTIGQRIAIEKNEKVKRNMKKGLEKKILKSEEENRKWKRLKNVGKGKK